MLGITLNLSACSKEAPTRPAASEYPRTETKAEPQDHSTALGRAIADDTKKNAGMSGFRFLSTGTESLQYRIALIRAAEKSIDLQYYTIHDDVSANLLLEALILAAQRGVRVRFLIDNISMSEVDRTLTILDGVKNIEIRVFNPIVTRHQSYLSRITGFISDFGKAFKRMHNKALIADNQLAIIGGRNLGDEYFEAHSDNNYKDADMLTAGPITARISQSFDRYWNGDDTFPITLLRKPVHAQQEIDGLRQELKAHWEKEAKTEGGKKTLLSNLSERLKRGEVGLIWAKAELRADEPEKINEHPDDAISKPKDSLQKLTENAKEEFVIISPYFVPREEGVAWLTGLAARDIKVRILTNSLSSTDVIAVHTGYRRYRETLIKGGVELYEFKAIDDKHPKQRLFGGTAPANASLHAKMYIVDRKDLLIGSFNLDPRSESLNTEIALLVHSAEIAAPALKMFNDAVSSGASYRLQLDKSGNLIWQDNEKGKEQVYHYEPEAGLRRIQSWLMGLLPVEDQL